MQYNTHTAKLVSRVQEGDVHLGGDRGRHDDPRHPGGQLCLWDARNGDGKTSQYLKEIKIS